jgi:peptide deformylase
LFKKRKSMKHLQDLLLLGDPRLYFVSEPVHEDEKDLVKEWVNDLHHVMEEIRAKYNFGRAIAAPQLGIMKRLIYMNIDKPVVFINPALVNLSEEKFELWDDCMSFPNLLVKVKRHKSLIINYLDENWQHQTWEMNDALSELLQHEYDHLNGILCIMRAVDDKAFKWKPLTPEGEQKNKV